jgi:cytochrome c-type biogenesis protein
MDVGSTLGPLIALVAGVLSFLSPCVLPLVPVYITHLAGSADSTSVGTQGRNDAFFHALSFVLGFSLVFIALGASVGLVGYVLRDQLPTLTRVAGVLLIALGLHLVGILRIPFLYRTYAPEGVGTGQRVGYAKSFVVGSTFSVGWTPCIGPILGSILTLAAASSTVWQGTVLLVFYSVGLGIPFLLTGLLFGTAIAQFKRISRFIPVFEVVGGVLVMVVGSLVFLDRLTVFNQYFDFFGFSGV